MTAVALLLFAKSAFAGGETYALGVSEFNKKNYSKAAQIFELSKKANANNPELYYYSALTYEHLGKYDRAAHDYVYVAKNFPETSAAALSITALKRPSFAALARGTVAGNRGPGLDTYPRETWVPFERIRNSVYVDATVNGRPMQMCFDTGASVCMLSIAALEQLGIEAPTGPPSGGVRGVGSNSSVAAWTIYTDLKLGKIERKHFPITVIQDPKAVPLLGENFYHDLRYTIDNASSTIVFKTQEAATSSPSVAGVTVGTNGKYVYNVPFTMEGASIIVMVKIEGHLCPCIFDTGADLCCFTPKQISDLGLHPLDTGHKMITRGAGGLSEASICQLKDVQLGPITADAFAAISSQALNPHPLLGQNFFKGYPYTIDHANKIIKFEK
jgi:predicted aspartyl protease